MKSSSPSTPSSSQFNTHRSCSNATTPGREDHKNTSNFRGVNAESNGVLSENKHDILLAIESDDATTLRELTFSTTKTTLQNLTFTIKNSKRKHNVLTFAVLNNAMGCLRFLLENTGVNASFTDSNGLNLLHFAAKCGYASICKYLLCRVGIATDKQTSSGRTALHYAALKGSLSCCRVLINSGAADPNTSTFKGWSALHWAAYAGKRIVCQYLVEETECNKNSRTNKGWTALHWACRNGQLNTCQYLIEKACLSPRVQDDCDGWTPLHFGAYGGHTGLCRYLIERCKVDSSISDNLSQTPHDVAFRNQKFATAKYLSNASFSSDDDDDDDDDFENDHSDDDDVDAEDVDRIKSRDNIDEAKHVCENASGEPEETDTKRGEEKELKFISQVVKVKHSRTIPSVPSSGCTETNEGIEIKNDKVSIIRGLDKTINIEAQFHKATSVEEKNSPTQNKNTERISQDFLMKKFDESKSQLNQSACFKTRNKDSTTPQTQDYKEPMEHADLQVKHVMSELASIRELHESRIGMLHHEIVRLDQELSAHRQQIKQLLKQDKLSREEIARLREKIHMQQHQALASKSMLETTQQHTMETKANSNDDERSRPNSETALKLNSAGYSRHSRSLTSLVPISARQRLSSLHTSSVNLAFRPLSRTLGEPHHMT